MMNRKITFALGLLLLMLAVVGYYLHKPRAPKTRLRCDAEITSRNRLSATGEPSAVLKTKMHFFLYSNGTGFIRLNGFIKHRGKTYVLNRELRYLYEIDDNDTGDEDSGGVYTLKFNADRKHSGDSVPTQLWEHFLQSEDYQVSYHVTIGHMIDNLYFVRTLPSPTFVCRRY
ncbi:TPA: hypothetical protein ACKQDN_002598 [Serratia marcescens]